MAYQHLRTKTTGGRYRPITTQKLVGSEVFYKKQTAEPDGLLYALIKNNMLTEF